MERSGFDILGAWKRSTGPMGEDQLLLRFENLSDYELAGVSLRKDAAFLKTISPIEAIDKINDPLFVYAGANDPRVPRAESDQVVKALRERGVPVEYMVADNEGHSVARRENQIALYSRVARFLEQELAPPPAQ